jgi:uncharacterized protein (DUF488 family)
MVRTEQVQLYTIGFTKKGAKRFFGLLEDADIQRLIDTRLSNRSQLSGFAKRDDLKYFLGRILDAEYEHRTDLAPTEQLLDQWRDNEIDWSTYEDRFFELIAERKIDESLTPDKFKTPTVLLCSEHSADRCHRRLIGEYLDNKWGNVEMTHLM